MAYVVDTIARLMAQPARRVYLISTYNIGKERILLAVHRQCGCKIGVSERKLGTMQCLELPGEEGSTSGSQCPCQVGFPPPSTLDCPTIPPESSSRPCSAWGCAGRLPAAASAHASQVVLRSCNIALCDVTVLPVFGAMLCLHATLCLSTGVDARLLQAFVTP